MESNGRHPAIIFIHIFPFLLAAIVQYFYVSLLCSVMGKSLCGFRFQSSISDSYLIKQCLLSNFVEKQLLRQKGKSLL